MFTLSTHTPYDYNYPVPVKFDGLEAEYSASAWYADHFLNEFFLEASKQPWYENTLFVMVPDHSHSSYRNWEPYTKEYQHIPMLFFGPMVKNEYKGIHWKHLGSQYDITATLLNQLRISSIEFHWSKNLLDPCSPRFAWYSTYNCIGWLRPNAYFVYDEFMKQYYKKEMEPSVEDSILREGHSYLQVLFQEYMDY